MVEYFSVAKISDFDDEDKLLVRIEETDILLIKAGGEYFAMNNRCGHMSASMFYGQVKDQTIECPLHGLVYDLKTGLMLSDEALDPHLKVVSEDMEAVIEGLGLPKIEKLPQKMFPVKVEGEDILIDAHPECD